MVLVVTPTKEIRLEDQLIRYRYKNVMDYMMSLCLNCIDFSIGLYNYSDVVVF